MRQINTAISLMALFSIISAHYARIAISFITREREQTSISKGFICLGLPEYIVYTCIYNYIDMSLVSAAVSNLISEKLLLSGKALVNSIE